MAPPRRRWDLSNEINNGGGDDSNIQLQEILFNSAKLYNNSRNSLKPNPNNVKKKGIDLSCNFVATNGRRINWKKYERGGPSCVFCTICDEPIPLPVNNDTITPAACGHVYCKECIVNYVRERIKETPTEVKCPVSDCKEKIPINEYFVPPEFMNQWRDTVREAKAFFACKVIECPFLGCSGYLIDDQKGFLLRTCPKCWTLFCVMCRDCCHTGMECMTNFKWKMRIRSLIHPKEDEKDDDEESNYLLSLLKHLKNV